MYRRGCKKFKYLQDNIWKGRTQQKSTDNEANYAEECHKIKLFEINLLSKSTDTRPLEEIQQKPEEPEVVKAPEIIEYETYSFTGNFRDDVRRIDLVLVLADTEDPEVKKLQTDFLMSIVKTGLEVENEPGLMAPHRNLTFVKIHAPYSVFKEYNEKLGVKKYFKDVHSEYIPPKTFLGFKNEEREWLSLVRNHYEEPLRHSNSERSLLVYKILLNLRFGEHQNNFGLMRLLNWNVVSDVYALHDGPYFLTRKQKFSEVTARQILYYKWARWSKIFSLQPLNLIQEYFGSRIGFYFAFLQFYNLGLAVACLIGILSTTFGILDSTYDSVRIYACSHDDIYVCPRCYDLHLCPFLELKKYYCFASKLVNVLDHLLLPVQCIFLTLWATTLMILWKRKEDYWLWMWELGHVKYLIHTRPEFSINYNKPVQSSDTGLWKYYNNGLNKLISTVITLAFYASCIYFSFLIFFEAVDLNSKKLKIYVNPEKLPADYEKYILIGTFTSILVVVLLAYEKICQIIAVIVTRIENHRSIESYERALALKLFIITSFCSYPMLIYYTWFKTRLFRLPGYQTDFHLSVWKKSKLLTIGFQRTCGLYPCIDEVFTCLTVCFLLKQGLPKIISLFLRSIWPIRTDYNQGKSIIKKYPCWEREYRLKSITEDRITSYYNYLALQFGYIILFGAASPLLPVAALILNVIDIRLTAKEFLLTSRRPLLLEKPGLDIWSKLFVVLAWSSILSNALLLAWSSRAVTRYVYLKSNTNMTNFDTFYVSPFTKDAYYLWPSITDYTGYKPDVCYYKGSYMLMDDYKKNYVGGGFYYVRPFFVRLPDDFEIERLNNMLMLAFHYLGLLVVLFIQFSIPPHRQDIEDSIIIEQNIKNAFLTQSNQ